jgi:hypothetical protein
MPQRALAQGGLDITESSDLHVGIVATGPRRTKGPMLRFPQNTPSNRPEINRSPRPMISASQSWRFFLVRAAAATFF